MKKVISMKDIMELCITRYMCKDTNIMLWYIF